jgi:predicted transcriptional regulator
MKLQNITEPKLTPKKIPLAEFKYEQELSQVAIGSMFGLSQGAVSEALRTSADGSRVFTISKAGKCEQSGNPLWQLNVEKPISVGTLPWH